MATAAGGAATVSSRRRRPVEHVDDKVVGRAGDESDHDLREGDGRGRLRAVEAVPWPR